MEIIEMKMTKKKLLNKRHSRVELTKDGISELEDGSVEFTPAEKNREIDYKKKNSVPYAWGTITKMANFILLKSQK